MDLDGTLYQTCDLYWKTNTAPADDRQGNERAVHVEIANLSWEALAKDSEWLPSNKDKYLNSILSHTHFFLKNFFRKLD